MPSIVELKTTVDLKKIQELMQKASVNILVGFPSGRPHIEAVHEQQDDGTFKNGSKVQTKFDQATKTERVVETWELAEELHYGSATTPARPFLEEGIEYKVDELKEAIGKELEKELNGGHANWNKIGTMAVGHIQEFVRSDYYKSTIPNSKEWQEQKGSDTPLIDGGDLINSMSFIVEEK